MSIILRYDKAHESALLTVLKAEPDWHAFTNDDAIDAFKRALLTSETYIVEDQGDVHGYLRALVDAFGVYVSELYVAPDHRSRGYGRALLDTVKRAHPDQAVYVLSDEDRYYEKLGSKRVGSVFLL